MGDFVLGVIGHVDHGKTALVRALTGVETDRLPEERRRGLTIEPGFAPLPLPGGGVAALVDVPGHEKFVRNMLAGAAGLDAALLVVAADDGVMPQTVEHLDLCALLGVGRWLVAVTKTDLLETNFFDLAYEKIQFFVQNSVLVGSTIFPVSAKTGAGIAELKAAIAALAGQIPPKDRSAPFRMDIDRVFSREGFGAVVTGSVSAGTVAAGEALTLYPEGKAVRTRGLQSHGVEAEGLAAGRRAALNLAGVRREELRRGQCVAAPGSLTATVYAEGTLTLLPHAPGPLKTGQRVRLCHGTAEVLCRCALRGQALLLPGQSCQVRLRPEEPIGAAVGDRFVVRALSPEATLGGGVLTALAPKRREQAPALREVLSEYHARYPLRGGMDKAELLQKCGTLEGAKVIGTTAFLPGFKPRYTPELAKIRDQIEVYYRRSKAQPTPNKEADALFDGEVLRKLLHDGVLIALGRDYRIHRRYWETYRENNG